MITSKSNKVLLITNIPNPYRIPLFNELNKQLQLKGLKLKVIFGALSYIRRKWEIDKSQWNFEYIVLSSKKVMLGNPEKTIFTYKGILGIIRRENPSVIITNGFSFATTKVWLHSWVRNIPFIIWSGAIHRHNKPDSLLRKLHRKILIKRASFFISYGKKAKDYLLSLGANPCKISIGINTVETEFFKNETDRIKLIGQDKNKKILLYIGNLTKGKRIDLLIRCITFLKKKRTDFLLKIVGEGPELENLQSLAKETSVSSHISFEGFKQRNFIPKYLAEADCFLFPSEYDIWGLVLVEAMAAGLPCIASIHAGATDDLIKDGENGLVMDFSESEEVANKINWILGNPDISKQFGRNASMFIVENLSIAKSASGFVRATIDTLNMNISHTKV